MAADKIGRRVSPFEVEGSYQVRPRRHASQRIALAAKCEAMDSSHHIGQERIAMREAHSATDAAGIIATLDEQIDALFRLIEDLQPGIASARHFDDAEECGQAIAKGIVGAFRSRRGRRC